MELLIIPLVLALGAYTLNRSEKNIELQNIEARSNLEREIVADRQHEAALQAYLDRMTDLLLKEKLRTTKKREVRDVARTRTLTVLRGLDATRKRLVLLFLHEAKLINDKNPIVDLAGADLQDVYIDSSDTIISLSHINLNNAILKRAGLRDAILQGAILTNANLDNADLLGAYMANANLASAHINHANLSLSTLKDANLRNANLYSANLDSADLEGADITSAILLDANLQDANLKGADLTNVDLKRANLKGATMPDGTKHD